MASGGDQQQHALLMALELNNRIDLLMSDSQGKIAVQEALLEVTNKQSEEIKQLRQDVDSRDQALTISNDKIRQLEQNIASLRSPLGAHKAMNRFDELSRALLVCRDREGFGDINKKLTQLKEALETVTNEDERGSASSALDELADDIDKLTDRTGLGDAIDAVADVQDAIYALEAVPSLHALKAKCLQLTAKTKALEKEASQLRMSKDEEISNVRNELKDAMDKEVRDLRTEFEVAANEQVHRLQTAIGARMDGMQSTIDTLSKTQADVLPTPAVDQVHDQVHDQVIDLSDDDTTSSPAIGKTTTLSLQTHWRKPTHKEAPFERASKRLATPASPTTTEMVRQEMPSLLTSQPTLPTSNLLVTGAPQPEASSLLTSQPTLPTSSLLVTGAPQPEASSLLTSQPTLPTSSLLVTGAPQPEASSLAARLASSMSTTGPQPTRALSHKRSYAHVTQPALAKDSPPADIFHSIRWAEQASSAGGPLLQVLVGELSKKHGDKLKEHWNQYLQEFGGSERELVDRYLSTNTQKCIRAFVGLKGTFDQKALVNAGFGCGGCYGEQFLCIKANSARNGLQVVPLTSNRRRMTSRPTDPDLYYYLKGDVVKWTGKAHEESRVAKGRELRSG